MRLIDKDMLAIAIDDTPSALFDRMVYSPELLNALAERQTEILNIIAERPVVYESDWQEGKPPEHPSRYAVYKGTDKWEDWMHETESNIVQVTLEWPKIHLYAKNMGHSIRGPRRTALAFTLNGEWHMCADGLYDTRVADKFVFVGADNEEHELPDLISYIRYWKPLSDPKEVTCDDKI